MNRKTWMVAAILCAATWATAEAQMFQHNPTALPPDPKPQPSDLTADQLLAKYNAGRGGEAKLKGIQNVKMTGTWTANVGNPTPVVVVIAPGRYVRRIAQGADIKMLNIVDGQATWELNTFNNVSKARPMDAKKAARFRRSADPQGPLVDAKAKGNKVEVVGKMPWRSSQVYKLKVTARDGSVSHIYLDATSFLPVRTVTSLYVAQLDKDIDMEIVYQGFRDVDGVKWPFTEEANAPEAGFKQNITWKSIEVNKPLDPAAFTPPKG